jgi:hypothetical protein
MKGIKVCYHWPVGDEYTVKRSEEILQEVLQSSEFSILSKVDVGQMKTKNTKEGHPETDITSLDFIGLTLEQRQMHYQKFLIPDLKLCGLSTVGTIPVLQNRLKKVWKFFNKIAQLKMDQKSVVHDRAMLNISQAIPCILHCEMRVGEKIIRMLLIEGITKTGVSIAEQMRLAKTNQTFINTTVLGSIISPAKDNKFKIGDVSMSNKNIIQ